MQILIVGCGKVGKALTEQLSKEDHNITVMDTDADKVRHLSDVYDVMGYVGNATDYEALQAADVEHTDILLAVTFSDEANLLCCVLAKKAANCKTIARVRNPIYSSGRDHLQKMLGLSMIINPEHAAAREMINLLTTPSAIDISTFAKGRLNMMRFKLPQDSPLIGKPVKELGAAYPDLLFCTAEHGDEVVIPDGEYVIRADDSLSILAPTTVAQTFFKKTGYRTDAVRSVMIVGGGETSYYLAQILLKMGIKVTIIEIKKDRCDELAALLPKANIIYGDGTDEDLLREENIDEMDAFVASSGIDEENIILSLYANDKVRTKVITKISHLEFENLINSLNLDSVINPKEITADYIVQYVRAMDNSVGSNVETLYKLMHDRVEALEFYIRPGCKLTGIKLMDMKLKKNVLVAGIVRGNNLIRPAGQDEFKEGDSVIIVTTNSGFRDINDIVR